MAFGRGRFFLLPDLTRGGSDLWSYVASTGAGTPGGLGRGALWAEMVGSPLFLFAPRVFPKGGPSWVEAGQCRRLGPWGQPVFLDRGTKEGAPGEGACEVNPREQSAGRVDPSLSTNADRRWLTPVGTDPKQHMKGPESRWAINHAGSQADRAPAVRCARRAQGGTAVSHRGWRSCGLNLTGLTAF